ncbi:MAG: NAD(P)-dependent oxidoreductase [Fimbriimonadaceae bacterium]|nr:NAD(P)-dependent oxidoreductase [Alphaproteobacteria bacterium]
MARIAFLGLGNMGRGMALRLAGAGYDIHVYNRTRVRAEALGDAVRIADTPRQAVEGAEVIFAMLADDDASRNVWRGDSGVFAGDFAENAVAIECSTLSHGWMMEFAGLARRNGMRPIDCPVTGLPDDASAGRLTLLVGAGNKDLDAARPFLQPISGNIIHFGDIGAGTAYKLMINLMGAVQISAAAEGLLIAEKAGLDLRLVLEALKTGQAASPQVVRNATRMIEGGHNTNITFSGALRMKDARYALELAQQLGINPRLGTAAQKTYKTLVDQAVEDQNESKLLDSLRAACKD